VNIISLLLYHQINKKVALLQGKPRDVAVNFDTYRNLQQHRAVFLRQHSFLALNCQSQFTAVTAMAISLLNAAKQT